MSSEIKVSQSFKDSIDGNLSKRSLSLSLSLRIGMRALVDVQKRKGREGFDGCGNLSA